MATNFDNPRVDRVDDELAEDSLEELKQQRRKNDVSDDVDPDSDDLPELPGSEVDEELNLRVLPRQADEFTCSSCFLVHHRSQLAIEKNGKLICRECAA